MALSLWGALQKQAFGPASVGLDELRDIACRERNGLAAQFTGLGDGDIGDQVWQKTLQEFETGALVGPIPLDQVPPEYPLSRRFGIRRGARVRCIDDFSRSSEQQCSVLREPKARHLGCLCSAVRPTDV